MNILNNVQVYWRYILSYCMNLPYIKETKIKSNKCNFLRIPKVSSK